MGRYVSNRDKGTSVRETFDIVAGGYDNQALRFFQDSAENMADYLSAVGNIRLLDVATGTGNAALTLARHMPEAKVTGVDFSAGMLAQARAKAKSRSLDNVEFLEMDMQSLTFPNDYFDAAVCAFGIFFVEEMERQLKHISEKIKSGGSILISCFYEKSFSPCVDLFLSRIEQYGIERPPLRWTDIATEAKCLSLFRNAGLADVRVDRKNLGYYLENEDKWWDIVMNAGHRGLVEQISHSDIDRFKNEHFREIRELRAKDGIRLNVEVLYAMGTKP